MQKQQTLKDKFCLQGKGLHTGLDIHITFCPAPEESGYKIKRVDLEGQPVIDAIADNVHSTRRGTVLKKGEVSVSTIEHAMAALYALGVDNCLIEVDAPEFPILDGSAEPYVSEIKRVGLVEQETPRDYYIIKKRMEVSDPESNSRCALALVGLLCSAAR